MTLLQRLIEEDFGLLESSGNRRYLRSKSHDSLIYDSTYDRFYWNSKNLSGNYYTYLLKIRSCSPSEIKKFLINNRENKTEFLLEPVTQTTEKKPHVPLPELVNIFYEKGLNNQQYWIDKRGYTVDTINKFKLGYTGEWYTIPIFENGEFVNFQIRKETPKRVKHWYNGVGPHPFNFSILANTNWVVITEGPPDCIMLRQAHINIPSVSHTAGSSYWKRDWNSLFSILQRIYIVYDNDNAGDTGAKRVAENFGYLAKIYNFWDFEKSGFDVTDFFKRGNSRGQLMELLETKSKYYWEI